jgi:hypothetical protein
MKTYDYRLIPLEINFLQIITCVSWATYGVLHEFIYILTPNSFGVFVAIVGSFIYCAYRPKYLKKMKLHDLKNESQGFDKIEMESPRKLQLETQDNDKIDT